jgi:peroxiredoxin
MKLRDWIAIGVILVLAGTAFGWARAQAIRRARLDSSLPAVSTVTLIEPDKHKVTPAMLEAAETHNKSLAPPFRLTDANGTIQDLSELVKDGPLVLVFIKDGCPCSVSAETYFNTIHSLYRGRLRFLGVIDGDANVARRWGSIQGVPFPILPDPKLEIAKQYGATNSAFVALINKSGQVEELWPGYSVSMLKDLNRRAAGLAGLEMETLETLDAPDELYSGCPFSDS